MLVLANKGIIVASCIATARTNKQTNKKYLVIFFDLVWKTEMWLSMVTSWIKGGLVG
jgi:hypothetical protein